MDSVQEPMTLLRERRVHSKSAAKSNPKKGSAFLSLTADERRVVLGGWLSTSLYPLSPVSFSGPPGNLPRREKRTPSYHVAAMQLLPDDGRHVRVIATLGRSWRRALIDSSERAALRLHSSSPRTKFSTIVAICNFPRRHSEAHRRTLTGFARGPFCIAMIQL
jgi:hypothetical protein